MIRHDIPQRSDEWRGLRLGKLTSSGAADMCATLKNGEEAASRRNLRTRLVLERLTGVPQESDWQSEAMRIGIEREAEAIEAYVERTGHEVWCGGFYEHDTLWAGCSPDGAIGDFIGLVEVKCPQPATHLGYLRSGQVPGEYLKQIYHQLWITGAPWCDFASFCPQFPESLRLFIARVTFPNGDADRAGWELTCRLFLKEVDTEYAEVAAMAEGWATV